MLAQDLTLPSMSNLAIHAAEFHLAYRLGVVKQSTIIDWSINSLEDFSDPPEVLVNITFMKDAHPGDLLGALEILANGVELLKVFPAVMQRAHQVLKEKPYLLKHFSRALYQIAAENDFSFPPEYQAAYGFDDELALAENGTYGTVDEIYQEVLEFTASFDKR